GGVFRIKQQRLPLYFAGRSPLMEEIFKANQTFTLSVCRQIQAQEFSIALPRFTLSSRMDTTPSTSATTENTRTSAQLKMGTVRGEYEGKKLHNERVVRGPNMEKHREGKQSNSNSSILT
ncbi:hypothetical protein ACJMK2_039578, partial [Sinanodonta woodiana]